MEKEKGGSSSVNITGIGEEMKGLSQDRRMAAPPPPPQKCPRCDSINTKFCYYNNYSLSQPRYFCKACRRYWTKGGTLRNVPAGGGCRKGKKPRKLSSSDVYQNQQQPFSSSPPFNEKEQDIKNDSSFITSLAGSGGGYMPYHAAIQSVNHSMGDYMRSQAPANFSTFQGFNLSLSQLPSPGTLPLVLGRERAIQELFPKETSSIQSTAPSSSSSLSQQVWQPSLNNTHVANTGYWNNYNNENTSNPNHWPDLSGFGTSSSSFL